jgi:hypothetical protein
MLENYSALLTVCLAHMAAFLSAVSLHLTSLFLLLFSFLKYTPLLEFERGLKDHCPVSTWIRNCN